MKKGLKGRSYEENGQKKSNEKFQQYEHGKKYLQSEEELGHDREQSAAHERRNRSEHRVEDQGKRQKDGKKFNAERSAKRNFTLGGPGEGDEEIN